MTGFGVTGLVPPLAGQDTLIACWRALATTCVGAAVRELDTALVAIFPSWAPLNNAIMYDASPAGASRALDDVAPLYDKAGVATWALWLPSRTDDFDRPDAGRVIDGMTRDTTTLVMRRTLSPGSPRSTFVTRTTVDAAERATDEIVPVHELPPPPDGAGGLDAWVAVCEGNAVAGAWSYLHGSDCGVYAVGTVAECRRRGIGRALMQHVLADGYERGARTATLQSTRMGEPLYRSLGFEAVGRYEEWVPN